MTTRSFSFGSKQHLKWECMNVLICLFSGPYNADEIVKFEIPGKLGGDDF